MSQENKIPALITIDDLCPVYIPEYNIDFGGRMDEKGIVEGLLIGTLINEYPEIKINLFTTPNYRYNIFNPLEPIPDNSYRLSSQETWVAWIKAKLRAYPQLVLSYHGWNHWRDSTLRPDEFAGYPDQATTVNALEKMVDEFRRVDLRAEKVFRPPGWGVNPWLLRWLADNGFILGDKPDMPTCSDPYGPSFFDLGNNKKLKRIPVTNQYYSLEEVIEKGGCYVMHYHMTEPNENSLTRPQNIDNLIKTLAHIRKNLADKITWLSYQEMSERLSGESDNDISVVKANYSNYVKLQEKGSDWSYGSHWGDQMEDAITSWFAKEVEKDAHILDLGCGEGRGVKALTDMGFSNVSGVDITVAKVNKGIGYGLNIFPDDMHTLKTVPDKKYDYIFTSHTLEHALSLEEVVRTLLRITKKKIYFIIPIHETKEFVEKNNPSHTSFINDPKESRLNQPR